MRKLLAVAHCADYMSVALDYSAKFFIPHVPHPGKEFLMRRRAGLEVCGCINHTSNIPLIPYFASLTNMLSGHVAEAVCHFALWAHDPNIVISILHEFIQRSLVAIIEEKKPWPRTLFVQLDNAGNQNKSAVCF